MKCGKAESMYVQAQTLPYKSFITQIVFDDNQLKSSSYSAQFIE